MQFSNSVLLAISAFVSCASSQQNPITDPVLGTDPFTGLHLPQNEYGAAVGAYLYASPLIGWARVAGGGKLKRGGVNKIRGGHGIPNSEGVSINLAQTNVDTVYGEALVDLSAEDLILNVPHLQPDRYISFSFFDPYSDDFAVISSVTNDPSGKYLIRPTLKTGRGGKTNQNCAGFVGCIDSPVLNFFLLVRVLAQPGNQTDLTYVQTFIKKSTLTPTNKHKPTAKALSQQDFDNLPQDRVMQAFELAARLSDRLPPQNTALATFIPFTLLAAGITHGKYTPVKGVDLSQVAAASSAISKAFVSSPQNVLRLNNGWTSAAPFWSGSFQGGTNIVARSHEAAIGYAQNTAEQSIYPVPGQGTFTLQEGDALLLDYSAKPPIKISGFWSLTLYHPHDGGTYPNPQGVHALGDRSALTYPDGTLVYGAANANRNDPFQLLIQPSDQEPPKNWTGNFLPAPRGQPFRLVFRLYAPVLKETIDPGASYIYPKITQTKAILP